MAHRVNERIQRLVIPVLGVVTFVLLGVGFSVSRTLLAVGMFLGVAMLLIVLIDPGPKAKGFVEGFKSRFR